MKNRLSSVILITVALGMFIIGVVDLTAQGSGTCGAMADQLFVNCWGTRLLRSITGWPTNIAATASDFLYGVLALVLAMTGRDDNE